MIFEALEGRCIVISNDCVSIAKASNQAQSLKLTERQRAVPWHVAPLRPWPGPGQAVQLPDGTQPLLAELIHSGRVKKYWEVPGLDDEGGNVIVPHSYVDLRFTTPLKPATLRVEERVASLDEDAVRELQAKLFVFFSGKALPQTLRCRHCGGMNDLELDALLEGDEAT